MRWLEAAGGFSWTIALLTTSLVTSSLVCAAARASRIVATTLLLAAILPLGVGLLGVLSGRQRAFESMWMFGTPNEQDIACGHARVDACLALGTAAFLVCGLAALAALRRAPKSGDRPAT
jgi:hypothetical protein